MKNRVRYKWLCITALAVFFVCKPTMDVCAQVENDNKERISSEPTDNGRVVRVGYYLKEKKQEEQEDGTYHTFTYDYFQEIAQITGWEYKYVQADFGKCMDMLKEGKIDLVCGVDRTKKRKKELSFSKYPSGNIQTKLYARADDETLTYEDFAALDGRKVAIISEYSPKKQFLQYCRQHNFKVQLKEYASQKEAEQAVIEKKADALLTDQVKDGAAFRILAKMDMQTQYFAAAKGSPLMKKLNAALEEIETTQPYFRDELAAKYRQQEESVCFSKEELDYIQKSPKLTVVYDPNQRPIMYYDEESDQFSGIAADIFRKIEACTGLKFVYKKIADHGEAKLYFQEGKADILAAMNHDYSLAKENQAYLTGPYLDAWRVMVVQGSHPDEIHSLAVPKDSDKKNQILRNKKEDQEVLYYDSINDCLKAVRDQKADATFVNSYVADYELSGAGFSALSEVQMEQQEENQAIAVSKHADPVLVRILNKALCSISPSEKETMILKHSLNQEPVTVKTLLYQNPETAIQVLVCVCGAALTAAFIFIIIRERRSRMLKKLSETDNLTGIYNRMASEQNIQRALQEDRKHGKKCMLISLDLDNFKRVNDTYGHMEGDRILIEVAQKMRSVLRGTDIVGRMGGDEFIIYVKGLDREAKPERILDKLLRAVNDVFTEKKEWYQVSASMGVSLDPYGTKSFHDMYREADVALYRAKNAGKAQYHIGA